MSITLALKYRPRTFSDVVEQDVQIQVLEYQIKNNLHKNAYLFTGPAGTGKTTCARIFADAINCGKGNPIEVDAARNNGVDDVRNIIDNSNFKSMESKYKVYILDEVHMFSAGAWNAMLKLLEEPPESTIILMCTTDPQKIPATILSRVQRYDFKKITFESVVNRLHHIIKEENLLGNPVNVEEEAVNYIAKIADGGMRDAITLLDKCLGLEKNLRVEDVIKVLGISGYDNMFDLLEAIIAQDAKKAAKIVEELHNNGVDMRAFIRQFYLFTIDLNKFNLFHNFKYIKIPELYKDRMTDLTDELCQSLMEEFTNFYHQTKWETGVKELLVGKVMLICQ